MSNTSGKRNPEFILRDLQIGTQVPLFELRMERLNG